MVSVPHKSAKYKRKTKEITPSKLNFLNKPGLPKDQMSLVIILLLLINISNKQAHDEKESFSGN